MIRDNLFRVNARIARACLRAGRDPGGITVVAVSKTRAAEEIREALEAGLSDIAENRVQEALLKYGDKRLATASRKIRWHLVGHLQTNKVKEAVKIFDLIHSLDSIRLAREIDKQAARIGKVQEVLVEVNASGETTKYGIAPEETHSFLRELGSFGNLKIRGLMTVAPAADNPENSRPYFRRLRELRDDFNAAAAGPLDILSMGMSGDFETAVEEGADMLRLGRIIFEGEYAG